MMTGEKRYHSVNSGARHDFIIWLAIDLDDKTVQMNFTNLSLARDIALLLWLHCTSRHYGDPLVV